MSLLNKVSLLSVSSLILFSTAVSAELIPGETQEVLLSRTGAEKPVIRSDAANQLKEFGDTQTISRLLQLTHDADWRVRFDSVKTLGRLGEPTATETILPLVQDPMPHVRMISVWSLYQIGDIHAVPAIIEAVKDKDPQVQHMAQRALKNISYTPQNRSYEQWSSWWHNNQDQIAADWE